MRAQEAICERAYDGMIAARAERLVWGTRVRENAEIPQEFWWARGRAAMKATWPSGDLDTYIDDRRTHCRAYGVEFARRDIERMLPQTRSVVSRAQRRAIMRQPLNVGPRLCRA
jgi:hypothetical protein